MGICNDMHQLARLHTAHLRQHVYKYRILRHIPVVSGEYVIGALVQHRIQRKPFLPFFLGYIEGHAISAGIQVHLAQILMHIEVRHNTP